MHTRQLITAYFTLHSFASSHHPKYSAMIKMIVCVKKYYERNIVQNGIIKKAESVLANRDDAILYSIFFNDCDTEQNSDDKKK